MFKNMKIEINDEVHLNAVCEVLESMGYRACYMTNRKAKSVCCYVLGHFNSYMSAVEEFDGILVSLTDLLALHDKHFMEKIHA